MLSACPLRALGRALSGKKSRPVFERSRRRNARWHKCIWLESLRRARTIANQRCLQRQ